MGILRSTKSGKSSIHDSDPFDGLDEVFLEKNIFAPAANAKPMRQRPFQSSDTSLDLSGRLKSLKPYIVIGVLITLTGFALARTKIFSYFGPQELVYAYFEVRALDGSGRPIAGAVVKNAGKRVGTTDSFGEWRRYMRVPLGSTVPVTLAKKSGPSTLLFATKNFAVPPTKPEKSEIELRGSVQLQSTDLSNPQANIAAQVAPNDMMMVNRGDAHGKEKTSTMIAVEGGLAKNVPSSDKTSIEKSRLQVKSELNQSSDFRSTHESIWFEVAGTSTANMPRDMLPALILRARELGLKVDKNAPWKVRLTNLMDKPVKMEKEGGGLILVSSTDQNNGGSEREFLRNYQSDSRTTAKGILYILAHHVNKNIAVQKIGERWIASLPKSSSELWRLEPGMSVVSAGQVFIIGDDAFANSADYGYGLRDSQAQPCASGLQNCELRTRSYAEIPPMPQWTRLRLKVMAYGKEPVKIFVSGYEAKLVGDRVYEYWGQDHARANVTLVLDGRIAARTQVLSDAKNPPVVGAATVTRR
jgi:hypothetical protein